MSRSFKSMQRYLKQIRKNLLRKTFEVHFVFQFPDTEEEEVLEQFEREKKKVLELFLRFVKVLSKQDEKKLTTPTLTVHSTERRLQSAIKMVEDHVTISYELVEEPVRKSNADISKTLQKANNA